MKVESKERTRTYISVECRQDACEFCHEHEPLKRAGAPDWELPVIGQVCGCQWCGPQGRRRL